MNNTSTNLDLDQEYIIQNDNDLEINENSKNLQSEKAETDVEIVVNQSDNDTDYDDELDEDFEQELAKELNNKQLSKTIDTFKNPQGIENHKESKITPGPKNNELECEELLNKMQNMSSNELNKYMKNMVKKNNFLGKNDFSQVSDKHRVDAKTRLQQKLTEKRNLRTSKKN